MQKARKNIPSDMGVSLIDQAVIDLEFSLTRPVSDFNTAGEKEHLKVYHQTPFSSLKGAVQ